MAQEIFFHQCVWVTKFCAKFGRSRIPRTARMHNSHKFYGVCERSQPLCSSCFIGERIFEGHYKCLFRKKSKYSKSSAMTT